MNLRKIKNGYNGIKQKGTVHSGTLSKYVVPLQYRCKVV